MNNQELPKPLPPEIVKVWQDAGAEVGWMGISEYGWLSFFRDEKEARGYRGGENLLATAVPSFRFSDWAPGVVENVPVPETAFGLAFGLGLQTTVTDAGSKQLARLKSLQLLNLSFTNVTGAGLKQLAGLESLQSLSLSHTQVTDAGLKELAGLKSLQSLSLSHTQVTGEGLKELAELKSLQLLALNRTKVTDAGLKELAGLKSLRALDIHYTQVTGAGLKELAGLERLQSLKLGGKQVTDAGLKDLAGLKSLRALDLEFTQVTDAGLKQIVGLKHLQSLDLSYTKVTDAGLKELAGLKLRQLEIPSSARTDVGLKHYLAALDNPTSLCLHRWNVTDAGLKELAGLTRLESLELWETQVTDAGLKELAVLKSLQSLNLNHTKVTDAGLMELVGLNSLRSLDLHSTQVTRAGLKELAGMKSLQSVRLFCTEVTSAQLKKLSGLKEVVPMSNSNPRRPDEIASDCFCMPDTQKGLEGFALLSLRIALHSYFSTYNSMRHNMHAFYPDRMRHSVDNPDEAHSTDYCSLSGQTIIHFQHFFELVCKDILRTKHELLASYARSSLVYLKLLKGEELTPDETETLRSVEFGVALKSIRDLLEAGQLDNRFAFIERAAPLLIQLNHLRNQLLHGGTRILRYTALDEFVGAHIFPLVKQVVCLPEYRPHDAVWKYNRLSCGIDPMNLIMADWQKREYDMMKVALLKELGRAAYEFVPENTRWRGKGEAWQCAERSAALEVQKKQYAAVRKCPVCGAKALVQYDGEEPVFNDLCDDPAFQEYWEPCGSSSYPAWYRCLHCTFEADYGNLPNPSKYNLPIADFWAGR